jgi:hypothetical protein
LYASPNIRFIKSRRMRWAEYVARLGDMRNANKILVGNSEGMNPLGVSRHRWEDNFRMAVREIGLEVVDWMHLAQDRDQRRALVNMVINFWFHKRRGMS